MRYNYGMGEFSPNMGSIEVKYTVGKVEANIETKIKETATKIIDSGILKKDKFKTEQDRNNASDRIVESLGFGFTSYKDMIDATCDDTRPEAQKNGKEAFDVLKKSISIAMNTGGDQELQTKLHTGGVSEALPEFWKYDNLSASRLDLPDAVIDVTITDKDILEKVRKLEKIKSRCDLDNNIEKGHLAEKVEDTVGELMDMDVPDDKEEELLGVKAYLNTEAGILRGELGTSDSSADSADVMAILNEAVAKLAESTGKMVKMEAEKAENEARIRKLREENSKKNIGGRSGLEMTYANDEFPEDPKEQLKYIEERLDIIENYQTGDFPRELSLADFKDPLLAILSKNLGSEFVRDIIYTRLSLKQIGDAMGDNFGSFGEHGDKIASLVKKVKGEGFDLNFRVMDTFYNNKIPGLKTAEAWDLMEKSNFDYGGMLQKALGEGSDELKADIRANFKKDEDFLKVEPLNLSKGTMLEGKSYNYQNDIIGNKVRAKILRKYLIEKMMKEEGIDKKKAEKSMQLAESMYNATMESCVVDWDFLAGNDYGELVNLQYCRIIDGSRGTKGKVVGPDVTLDVIKSVTPGWIRSFCGLNDPSKEVLSADIIKYGLTPNEKNNEIGLSGKGTYEAHFISVVTGKILKAKQLITMENTPLQKDALNTQFWQKQFDYFQKIKSDTKGKNSPDFDPKKEDMTRAAYFAGQLELAFNNRDSTWTTNDFKLLERIVTKDIIANKGTDEAQAFLTEKEWEWVKNKINYKKAMRSLFWFNLTQSMLRGGKKK